MHTILLEHKRQFEEKFNGYTPVYKFAVKDQWESNLAWYIGNQLVLFSSEYIPDVHREYTLGMLYFGLYSFITREDLVFVEGITHLWDKDLNYQGVITAPINPILL